MWIFCSLFEFFITFESLITYFLSMLDVTSGAVYLSLHHVGIFCALIVLLWTVKSVLILDVVIYMRWSLLLY